MGEKEAKVEGFLVFILIFSLLLMLFVTAPSVTLVSPSSGSGYNTTNSITFNCSVSDSNYLDNITLYHDINGSFSANSTQHFGTDNEIIPARKEGQVLLLRFNNDSSVGENSSLVYDYSGNKNNGTVIEVDYNNTGGKFSGGFEFKRGYNGSDIPDESIAVQDANSLDLITEGTIEIWVKPNIAPSWNDWAILAKGDSDYEVSPYSLLLTTSPAYCRPQILLADGDGYDAVTMPSPGYNCTDGEWHHIAATWNGTEIRLYSDGVLNNSDDQTKTLFNSPGVLRIGKNSVIQTTFLGTIDEIAIYNRTLTAEEIAIHAGLKPNDTSQTWTVRNIPDGNYKWNCFSSDNTSEGNWSSGNNTFYVNVNPPTFNNVSNNPSSLDDMDPGVNITVTANISEPFAMSAILQYKSPGASQWSNATMTNSTVELYNASFTPNTNGVWSYRVWANDSDGNTNISTQNNLTIEFDYTWTWERDSAFLGTIAGFLDTTQSVGVFTINNTGDYSLNFDLSNNAPYGMTYNLTEPFDLATKTVKRINVSATFASVIREDDVTITVNATNSDADPPVATINVTLASYSGGAYLDVQITDYPASVNQSSNASLKAYVRNIGNETALSTWLNWSLPTGWTNMTGNMSFFVGNLTVDSTVYNNITANVSSSAIAGVAIINAKASCNSNSSDSQNKTMTVYCYSGDGVCGAGCSRITDTDCPLDVITVDTGGGGGGTAGSVGGGALEKEEIIISRHVHIVRGEKGNFTIDVTNNFKNSVLDDLVVELTGFLKQYVSITPSKLTGIRYGRTKSFNVDIAVPTYLDYGNYTLTAKITGIIAKTVDDVYNEKQLTITDYILLIVHEVSKETATLSLNDAQETIDRMMESGFILNKTLKLFDKAATHLEDDEYEAAYEIAEQIVSIGNKAYTADSLIKEIQEVIRKAEKNGLKVPETKDILNLALAAFEREDFEAAESRAKDAEVSVALETKGQFNILRFAANYWWAMLSGFLVVSTSSLFTYRKLLMIRISSRLKNFAKEESTILKLMRETQRKAFQKKQLSSAEYFRTMLQYNNRLRKIRMTSAKLRSKRVSMIKTEGELNNLKREGEAIIKMLETLQENYFQKGIVTKNKYQQEKEAAYIRLAEIEEARALLKTQLKEDKKKKPKKKPKKRSKKWKRKR